MKQPDLSKTRRRLKGRGFLGKVVMFFSTFLLVQLVFLGSVWITIEKLEANSLEKASGNASVLQLYRVSNRIVLLFASGIKQAYKLEEYDSKSYKAALASLPKEVESLKETVPALNTVRKKVEKLEDVVEHSLSLMQPTRDSFIVGNRRDNHVYMAQLHKNIGDAFSLLEDCMEELDTIDKKQEAASIDENVDQYLLIVGISISLVFLLVGLVGFQALFVSRINALARSVTRYSIGQKVEIGKVSEDEIGRLESRFGNMVEKLEDLKSKEDSITPVGEDIVFTMTNGGVITSINDACKKHWGYEPDQLLGERLLNLLDKNDCEKFIEALEGLPRILTAKLELIIVRKSGDNLKSYLTFNYDTNSTEIHCTAIDITSQKNIELLRAINKELLDTILNTVPVCLLTLDHRMNVLSLNSSAKTLFGDCSRASIADILKAKAPNLSTEILGEIESGRLDDGVIEISPQQNDSVRIFSCNSKVIQDSGDRVVLFELQDITLEKSVEKFKSDLVSMVSHDLRTPLTSAQFALDMVASGDYGDLSRDLGEEFEESSRQLNEVILRLSDYLLLEKIMDGNYVFDDIEIDLQELLAATFEEVKKKTAIDFVINKTYKEIVADETYFSMALLHIFEKLTRLENAPDTVLVELSGEGKNCEISIGYSGSFISNFEVSNPFSSAKGLAAGIPTPTSVTKDRGLVDFVSSSSFDISFILACELLNRQGWSIKTERVKESSSKNKILLRYEPG